MRKRYRFFDSSNFKPLLPFGNGLSYTDFKIDYIGISNNKYDFNIRVKAINTGKVEGKEVVQIYWSPSKEIKTNLINQKLSSKNFIKTRRFKKTKYRF